MVIGGLLASVVTTSSASAAILTAEECGTAAGTPAVEAVAISQVRAIKLHATPHRTYWALAS